MNEKRIMDGLVDGSNSEEGPSNPSPYPSPYQSIHLLYEYKKQHFTHIHIHIHKC